jgi:hypothetical protein
MEAASRRMPQTGLLAGELVDEGERWDEQGDLTSGFPAHVHVAQDRCIRSRTEGGGCRSLDLETREVIRECGPP